MQLLDEGQSVQPARRELRSRFLTSRLPAALQAWCRLLRMLPLLQRAVRSQAVLRCPSRRGLLHRSQHSNGGPHKEYFQDPSRVPSRENVLRPKTPPSLPQKTYFPPESSSFMGTAGRRRSFVFLALRSTAWLSASALAGLATGAGILAWAYLMAPYEPGTEDDTDLLQLCEDEFNGHPMIQATRNTPGWREAYVVKDDFSSKHFVHGSLRGSRGIQFRAFYNPDSKLALVFVMFGSGMEGWPDVVHGGGLCTILEDTTRFLIGNLYPDKLALVSDMQTEFKKMTEPNVIYTLWLGTSSVVLDLETDETILKPPSTSAHPLHESVRVLGTIVPTTTDRAPNHRDAAIEDPFVRSTITVIFPKIVEVPPLDEETEEGRGT